MGFQFNSVGGGTKTRRPITLHMKYNPSCVQPACYLVTEELQEREMGLEELQDYIEAENSRLEVEEKFLSKEIVVKIEYKYSPNLTIIDTPGLISAAPGKKNGTLQGYSRQVESMVRGKMEQQEYIILCLEDTNDWSNATTRQLVMQVDPNLTRTVLVSTKFDTRIPQFARGSDVEMFLKPANLGCDSMLGGGPFFTSVPSGRVGTGKDAVFKTNEFFRDAVIERETQDVTEIEGKMGRRLDKTERSHIGVSQLRRFLEQLLQRRYLENVPTIVPVLDKEYRNAQARYESTREEMTGLAPDRLKEKGRSFVEAFLSKLQLILRGTVTAPPEKFGETLVDEHMRGGSFVGPAEKAVTVPENLPNAHMRLFGGAQFHRAMAEFRLAIGQMQCPDITREEIANACGVDDFHDGVNYMRTACVIAVTKSREIFEPFIHQLGARLSHVLRRLLPIAIYLLQRDGQFPSGHEVFLKRISTAFHSFIEEVEKSCKSRCLEDLHSTTRYVTWSLHTKNQKSLKAMLTKVRMPDVRSHALPEDRKDVNASADAGSNTIVDLLETTLWNRSLSVTSEEIVGALVCQIFESIRDHVVQAAELKFNCFFLMPVVDSFPSKLREDLEVAYDENDLDEVFDVAAVRATLEGRMRSLQSEVKQVEKIQRKFASIHTTLAQQQAFLAAASIPGDVSSKAHVDSTMMSLTDSAAVASAAAPAPAPAPVVKTVPAAPPAKALQAPPVPRTTTEDTALKAAPTSKVPPLGLGVMNALSKFNQVNQPVGGAEPVK